VLIDDFSDKNLVSALNTQWRGVSDKVMGGTSEAAIAFESIDGHSCLRLTGNVSLENSGGFLQAKLNLAPRGKTLDASGFTGIRMLARGNGEQYSVHLRTQANVRPWQSYRAHFTTTADWNKFELPFSGLTPHRLAEELDIKRLRRIGLVAIGREFYADLAVAELSLYCSI
jgi:hypothetical protein